MLKHAPAIAKPKKPEPVSRGRKAPKELRRRQLINATIAALARKGYAGITMADVAEGAGLSHGIVNFHFESKDELLLETLRFLSDEYRDNWQGEQEKAGPEPAARMAALISADFNRNICSHKKLAAWCAFWGEAKSRPTYQKMCGARDEGYHRVLADLCTALGGKRRAFDAIATAHAIGSMTEGLWMRVMMNSISREEGETIALKSLEAFFPDHFPAGHAAAPVKKKKAAQEETYQ
jgi:AcrR family transcriptional regulator